MKTGDAIGKYRLVSRLGRGGMGEVWLAKAAGYGGFTKTVVLKTLLPELASDPLFVELLAREAKTCSTLSHPNLIEVFDFTKHGDVYLLAMEHVLGQPLNAIMRAATAQGMRLPDWFILRVAWECCVGVQYAHEQGVIHCDLSPSNVMITYTGATKVLDFGVAHTQALGPRSDRLKGKYSYMAPERIKTRATDRRTDIYSLGVTLYLAFTGQLPFVAENDAALFYKIAHEKVIAPSALADIEPEIEHVFLRAMHPDAERRYQTVTEVLDALAPCLEGRLGTYGQQHVAAYLASLFGPAAKPSHAPRTLPPVPPPAPRRATTTPTAATDDLFEELEIDVDTAPHSIPRAPANDAVTAPMRVPSPPPPPLARRPQASDQIRAIAAPSPQSSPAVPEARPLIQAFAQASTPLEPTTSVQSLFGERPTQATTLSALFSRSERDDLGEAPYPFTNVTDPESGGGPPAPEPSWPEPDGGGRLRGAFGAYSSRRSTPTEVWPWPTSRTKSE